MYLFGPSSAPDLGRLAKMGTTACTPEIDTSEIFVDFQWHVPTDSKWYFPKGSSLFSGMFQRIVTCPVDFVGIVQCMFRGIFQCRLRTTLRRELEYRTPRSHSPVKLLVV